MASEFHDPLISAPHSARVMGMQVGTLSFLCECWSPCVHITHPYPLSHLFSPVVQERAQVGSTHFVPAPNLNDYQTNVS